MPFTVACDFDGTLAEDAFPGIGAPKEDVIRKVLQLQEAGADIVLWTCREREHLEEAVKFCEDHGIKLAAVNDNTPARKEKITEDNFYAQHKIHANIYVDDKSPGSIEFFVQIDAEKTCQNYD